MPDPTEANGDIVMGVAELLRREDQGVDSLPGKIKVMIDRESWRSFRDPKGELHTHEDFGEFVAAAPFDGLGLDLKRFVTYAKADAALEARVRNLLNAGRRGGDRGNQHTGGKPAKGDNIPLATEARGTSKAATIRRLLKDDLDGLAGRVESGELSAAAARREAGYKSLPKRSIRIDSPEEAVKALLRVFSREELLQALELTSRGRTGA